MGLDLNYFKQLFESYARIGVNEVEDSRKSSRYAFNLLCLLGLAAAIFYAALYFIVGHWQMGVSVAPFLLLGSLPYIMRRSERVSAALGILICCIGFSALAWLAGRNALLHLYMIIGVLNLVILRGTTAPRETAILGGIATFVAAFCHFSFAAPALGDAITQEFTRNLATLNIFGLGGMLMVTLLTLSLQIRHVQGLLAAEHARSEALLLNLLPTDIAARLKANPGEVIADGLPAITLLFADIVDFTPRSARMSPENLVEFLNRIFSEFDGLTAERGLEKIKTIGDAYMVAAGLPIARDDHAEVIADMALAMQQVVARLSVEMEEEVDLRIGIHSGPAIAGVIGTSKVFYDVWGDTVNTASRMESFGEPGRIQVTAPTMHLLKDKYYFTRRGLVDIKGIGQVETWWLQDERKSA